jgi:dimeric dUTPase (all-alpha-NTP-PPase superfamily)
MNLERLFQTQKVLRDRIGYNEPDRFNKLILALLVELGECANEWRGFKFWSTNQSPRTQKARAPYMDLDDADFYNPLLEEFVDCLHFILELGLELEIRVNSIQELYWICDEESITDQFRVCYYAINQECDDDEKWFNGVFTAFKALGKHLGFTWDEIEQAYFTKNKINHVRQETGY